MQLRWPANIGSELALRLLTANVASIVDEKLLNEHAQQGTTAMPAAQPFRRRRSVSGKQLCAARGAAVRPQRLCAVAGQTENGVVQNVSDAGTRRLLLLKGDADVAYDLGPISSTRCAMRRAYASSRPMRPGSITSVSTPAAKTTRRWAIRHCGRRRAGWWIIRASPSSC